MHYMQKVSYLFHHLHGQIVRQMHDCFNGLIYSPKWDTSHEVPLRVYSHIHRNPLKYREKLIHMRC